MAQQFASHCHNQSTNCLVHTLTNCAHMIGRHKKNIFNWPLSLHLSTRRFFPKSYCFWWKQIWCLFSAIQTPKHEFVPLLQHPASALPLSFLPQTHPPSLPIFVRSSWPEAARRRRGSAIPPGFHQGEWGCLALPITRGIQTLAISGD